MVKVYKKNVSVVMVNYVGPVLVLVLLTAVHDQGRSQGYEHVYAQR